jgi:uncharacterized protein (DUF697 family)
MIASIAAGVIPIPVVDWVVLSGIQLKMLHKLTQLYEIPFSKNVGKSLISALLGGMLPTYATASVAGSLMKLVPFGGTATGMMTMSAFGGASTYALGKVFIQHFESGGTLLTFDPGRMREYFAAQFQQGQEQVRAQQESKGSEEATAY